ncbi:prepilin peptidase [Rubeoparvulum massiliense]|uniref:prepilin peptidase n=1 Tax=Rubeoparvulum massiliense TaxID=1631346 RepID=UPI00065DD968|nr:A24 family peptidase [Rubeoparvulum massiliense]
MNLFFTIYWFILGTCLGSFYQVVGTRIPEKGSMIAPPSHCAECKHRLGWRELIPILSYLWQRGRCRHCESRISPLYPIMELLTGVLYAYAFYRFGWSGQFLMAGSIIALLVMITVSDLLYMLIPNKILLFFAGWFTLVRFFYPFAPWKQMIIGAIVGFLLLLIIAMISRGGMGGGDIKLFALIGYLLGWKGVLATLFLSSLYGTIIGLFGMLRGNVQRGKPFPFGPSIALGMLTLLFFSEDLYALYLSWLQD